MKLEAALSQSSDTVWNMSKYGVFPGPYFPAFGLNAERYFIPLRIHSECGKIQTRKNSGFGHFSRSVTVTYSEIIFRVPSCKNWGILIWKIRLKFRCFYFLAFVSYWYSLGNSKISPTKFSCWVIFLANLLFKNV